MKGIFRQSGTKAVVFALLLGVFAIGTWQTASAKENPGQNIFSSIFGSISNLLTTEKIENTPGIQRRETGDQLGGVSCSTAGPIEIQSTGGTTTPTAYATLKDGFDAINAGTHTGSISVEVCGNTTETATASLDASGTGTASYTDVTIRPAGGTRTIEGTITGAIVKLNGADNVTIDGRQGGAGTARDLFIKNNSSATGSAAVWLSSLGADAGATNNVIRNLDLACGVSNTNALSTFGIIMSGTSISTTSNGNDNDNNQFIFNRITSARYGIVTRGVTTNNNIAPVVTDNIIGPDAFGPDGISKTGILMQADTGAIVSRNTIQFIGGDLANTTAGTDRIGIGIGTEAWSATSTSTITSGDYTVTKNIIRNVVEERTFSAVGILLGTTRGGSPTNNLVANNFIYNVRSNGTSGDQPVGIGMAGGHTDSIVFNSISITGDMDPDGATSATTYGNAIRITGANGTNNANFTVNNNSIYMDVNSNTTTLPYFAITLNSAAYSFGTGSLNYNNYYVNLANTQMNTGGLSSTSTAPTAGNTFNTLAQWQAALTEPQDANSIQADPLYASPTSDLHLTGSSPNINAGTNIAAITDDIDEQVRPNAMISDIGADEFYASPGSLQLSSDTYDGNEGATLTTTVNRTGGSSGTVGVTYTLTDGTATGGAACTAGVDFINPGPQVLSFGDGVVSQTVDVTLCTDTAFDPFEAFSITLSNPTGGATLGSPTAATVTITDVPPPFSGSINVGAGEQYTSLTNIGGLFQAINLGGLSANLEINITSDLTGETGEIALDEVAGGFSITIRPSGASRLISGSSISAVIRLNGADNVTIDGALAAPPDGAVGGNDAIRNLTIENTSPSATSGAVIALLTGPNGAQNNTIKNVKVFGQDPTQTLIGIHVGGNTVGSSGADNDNNRIENCSIRRAFIGIYNAGTSAANPNTGNVITMNDLTGTGADRLRRAGMLFFNHDGLQVTENSIGGIDGDEAIDVYGIGAGIQAFSTATTAAGGIINSVIAGNKINGIASSSTTGFSAVGIGIAGASGGPNTVANNMITGVIAPSTPSDLTAGIFVAGATSSDTRLYYNSVSMTGSRGDVASQSPSYAVAITGTNPVVELKNNIFYTTQTSGGGANAKSYAIGTVGSTFTNLDTNYNDYYSAGANDGGFRSGSLAAGAGTDYPDLAAWQAAVSDDANSQEVDPLFVNDASDLHLQPMTPLENDGTPITAVTDDFDGEPRSMTAPEIGADELTVPAAPGSLQFSSATYSGDEGSSPFTVTVTRTGGSSGTVTVDFATSDGTATGGAACTAGVDYITNSGTLTFMDGVTSQTFDVVVCNDAADEPDETINYALSNATGGATIGTPAAAVQTIVDDDAPPAQFAFSINDAKVTEGDSGTVNATFTVTLSNVVPGSSAGGTIASVQYSTANGTAAAGADFVATSGTLNFSSTGTMTVTVPVIGETVKEANETFYVVLSNASAGATITDGQGVGIIVDEDRAYPADYDRDLEADYSVYRPSNSTFYIYPTASGFPIFYTFGMTGDVSVPGDYDGDGKTDYAVYRPSNGVWYVVRSSDSVVLFIEWGTSTDKPVQGDYNGDGQTDFAVFRPADGTWYILPSSDFTPYAIQFGISTDLPVQADYDGDFETDVAVYRDGVWYILQSSDGSVFIQTWGLSTDRPVAGDFDGDGRSDLTVYRDGDWYIYRSLTNDFVVINWGIAGDIPIVADYDADGTSDVAVFRPADGSWYILNSSDGTSVVFNWGQTGDVPTPSAYQPQ